MGFSFWLSLLTTVLLTVTKALPHQRPFVRRVGNFASWCDRVLIASRQPGVSVLQRKYDSFTMIDAPGIGQSDHDPIYMDVEVQFAVSPAASMSAVSSLSKTVDIKALVISWNVEEHVNFIDETVRDTLLSPLTPHHDIVFISIQEGGKLDKYGHVLRIFKPKLEGLSKDGDFEFAG
eukprot:435558_1